MKKMIKSYFKNRRAVRRFRQWQLLENLKNMYYTNKISRVTFLYLYNKNYALYKKI